MEINKYISEDKVKEFYSLYESKVGELKKAFSDEITDKDLLSRIEKISLWKISAKTEEESKQADEALEILVKDIPITLKALDPKIKEKVIAITKFGIGIAKIFLK